MTVVYLTIAFGFLGVILLNFFTVRYIILRALKKYVKPKLLESALTYLDWKWAGFFTSGDFNEKPEFTLITSSNGSPEISIFVYVFYGDTTSRKRVTVKIEILFFFIRNVKYSHEL